MKQRMKRSSTSLSSAFFLLCPHIAMRANKTSELAFHVKVEVQVDDIRSTSWNSGVKHEAGYDAFMTGCIFAQSCTHMGIDFKQEQPSADLVNEEKLQKQLNLLYLSWINGDIINLRTGKRVPDLLGINSLRKQGPNILFENTVLIWRFPPNLKMVQIREGICKVFGLTSVTSIYRVDETAVFVQFNKPELVSDFLTLKEHLERSNDTISILHPLSKLLEGGNTCAADYETYKKLCSSPISKVLLADQADAVGIKCKTKLVEHQVEVQTQDHESVDRENAATAKSKTSSLGKRKKGRRNRVVNDPSPSVSSSNVVDDSFYGSEVKKIGATNS